MKTSLEAYPVIGFAGMAKNTGKTTTLNHVIQLFSGQVALTSIGLDGESIDQLTGLPKPAIDTVAGMVIATARSTLSAATATVTVLEETPFQTALGPVCIVRVRRAGTVCVAGPTTNRDLQSVIEHLQAYHPHVLIDGALERRTFAGIKSMSGMVLATGAAVSPDMAETIKKPAHVERLFALPTFSDLPRWPAEMRLAYHDAEGDLVWLKKDYRVLTTIKDRLIRGGTLYVRGAITSRLTSFLRDHRLGGFNIVAEDATKYTLSLQEFAVFDHLGVSAYVTRRCPLLAITLNPWSPTGHHYEAAHFYTAAVTALKTPVYNVLERT
ncbi:MAG: hypothetical protein EA374_03995 [Acholeplasmatales bacterium]|nr:MAG: hypothetical protein EA374_03995 [Acholeplasmatales bacterium]